MNYETSFEAEVLDRTHYCEVWGYDYRTNSFGSIKRDHRAHFHPWGLANVDTHGPNDEHKLYTLKTLLDMNSEFSLQPYLHHDTILSTEHQYIDILKIDIEGWEFEVLSQILQPYIASGEPVPFGQLLIEIHAWDKKFEDFLSWWEMLESAGLRPFMAEVCVTVHLSVDYAYIVQVNLVYQNYNRGSDAALTEVCHPEFSTAVVEVLTAFSSTPSLMSKAATFSLPTLHQRFQMVL